MLFVMWRSERLTALNDSDENHHNSDYEKDVNESTQRVARNKPEQPKDKKDNSDGVKHNSVWLMVD